MEIQVNGELRTVREGLSLADFVRDLGLTPQRVAVELNRQLVTRARYDLTPLRPGDVVEIVTLVGGG